MTTMNNENIYDSTVDESRQRSMEKALELLYEELEQRKVEEAPLVRPDIQPHKGVFKLALGLCVLIALHLAVAFAVRRLGLRWVLIPVIDLCAIAAALVLFSRRMIVWSVLMYQKYAPESLRRSCVFEPTCSNYMLLAIEKHGVVKGVCKGIGRLSRCHYPNYGIDEP
jgi:Uncharacterized conserved protein